MSKYADLAHKIVDMVHATHKEEVRKARTDEKVKAKEEKAKAKLEADGEDKEQEGPCEKCGKEPCECEDSEKGDAGEGEPAPTGDEKGEPVGDNSEEPPPEGEAPVDAAPPEDGAPPADAEAPPAADSMGRPITGMGKKSPITTKKDKEKVKMSGKKEKVKVESFDDVDQMIEDRQKYLNERYSFDWETVNSEFGVREKMIAEGMWDGDIADSAEMYGKPDLSQLHIYRLLELYKAAGMNLDQSLQTIEHLYGVQVQTDSNGNLDFSDTDYSKGDTYGRNDGANLDYMKPSVIREQ